MLNNVQKWVVIVSVLIVLAVMGAYQMWMCSQPARETSRRSERSPMSESARDAQTKAAAVPTTETALPDNHFVLTAKTRSVIQTAERETHVDGDIELKYAHEKTPEGIVVTFYSLGMKRFDGSRLIEGTTITRDRFVQQWESQTKEVPFQELPDAQQERMRASFASRYCKIRLDNSQNETGREMFADAENCMISEGLLNTTRLVHGPFHKDSSSWTSVKRIPMEMALVIDCPVQYDKPAGPSTLKVEGVFSKDLIRAGSSSLAVSNAVCKLSGTEAFDESSGEYVSAELALKYSFDAIEEGSKKATLRGEITLVLKRVVNRNLTENKN